MSELTIERTFNAPVAQVWKYFSEPEFFVKWWGPRNFTAKVKELDFKVGGRFLGAMHGEPGTELDKDFWSTGIYKEILPEKRIVVTDSFSDENGNVISSSEYGMEGFPLEMTINLEFEETNDSKTKLKLIHEGIPEGENSDNARTGWNESLDKLEEALSQRT